MGIFWKCWDAFFAQNKSKVSSSSFSLLLAFLFLDIYGVRSFSLDIVHKIVNITTTLVFLRATFTSHWSEKYRREPTNLIWRRNIISCGIHFRDDNIFNIFQFLS